MEKTRAPLRERLWPRRTTAEAESGATTTGETPTRTVVVERRPRRLQRRRKHNPVSAMVMAAGWAAALILALGMLLTWGDANPGNTIVDATLDAGRWLATPFHDAFTRPNPEHQLYLNWGIAAVVYYAMARVVSWLIRF
ncbi:hypothetical protein [Spirillospora sp. NPDC047279]|uniref:hypothetical protein n=1 Tax=Spirillospora sp. NPDC047279 TaxID=3155478 RepID=UPI00340CBA62